MIALKQLHEKIEQLCSLMPQLDEYAQLVQVESSLDAPWRDSLLSKLRVQSREDSPLIVAIAGGTNIGKSTIFNHLAQDNASGITPRASGTKYPVCLVPEAWADEEKLQKLFDGFDVQPWSDQNAPLEDHESDVLYWRRGDRVPPQLILLDTPDVDSTNQANWRRAEKIRQIADVLIAVLTKQKYNDKICVDFFRQAAKSGKEFILLFNQFDLEDVSYLPSMLGEVVNNIQQPPIYVYLTPHDRKASESLGLPFYFIPLNKDGSAALDQADLTKSTSLTDELAKLHFEELKSRSLAKSLTDAMDSETGLGKWLSDIGEQSEQFAHRLKALEGYNPGTIEVPPLPKEMIYKELQLWRSSIRNSWITWASAPTVAIEKAWNTAVSFFKKKDSKDEPTQEELFLEKERKSMFDALDKIYNSLKNQAALDTTLGNELKALLASNSIETIIQRVEEEHKSAPLLTEDFHEYVRSQLKEWSEKHPWQFLTYKAIDSTLVIARPAAVVALGTCFWLTPSVTLGAMTAVPTLLDPMSLGDKCCKIQNRFCVERAQWLQTIIRQELHLDELVEKMKRQSEVIEEEAYKQALALQQELASP